MTPARKVACYLTTSIWLATGTNARLVAAQTSPEQPTNQAGTPESPARQPSATQPTPAPAPAPDATPNTRNDVGAQAVAPPAPHPTAVHQQVYHAVLDAEKSLTSGSFQEFYTSHPKEGEWLIRWCHAKMASKKKLPDAVNSVCATLEVVYVKQGLVPPEANQAEFKAVGIFELAEAMREASPLKCSGFNLTVPLYSVRLLKNKETELSGPIKAGLGGGYYYGAVCRESFSTGPEIFGYSEGLDPSGKFQIGIGAGWQFAAFKYFQFGVDVGYDLFRQTPAAAGGSATKNGIFAFKDAGPRPSMSFLFTFSIIGSTTSGTQPDQD